MGNCCRSFSLASILAPAAGEAGGENSIRKVHLDFSNMEEDGDAEEDAEKSTLEHGEWRCRGGCRKKYMSPLEHGEWRDRRGCRKNPKVHEHIRTQKRVEYEDVKTNKSYYL